MLLRTAANARQGATRPALGRGQRQGAGRFLRPAPCRLPFLGSRETLASDQYPFGTIIHEKPSLTHLLGPTA